jgi:hypothetical protein
MIIYAADAVKNPSTTVTTIDQSPAVAVEIEKYSKQFLSLAKASTENTVAMCEVLHKAKLEFKEKHNDKQLFQALCKHVGYTKGANDPTIKKFLRIGECAERFKPYLDRLPNSWTTLYEITQLDTELFDHAIENGAINIKMIGKEVRSLKQINQPKIEKPAISPDKKPSIEIILDADIDKSMLDGLCKELEALKFNFKIEIKANDVAQTILNRSI